MTSKPWKPIGFCIALLAAGPAFAQSAERVATHTDWSVFVAGNPKECYIVSPPTASADRRDGAAVEVTRGDIRLFVTFRPGDGVANEVSFSSGYPFQDGSAARLEVGGQSFTLSPGQGEANEWAWTDPSDDGRAVSALRGGANATVSGSSARGTTTVDTFSLMGFTAAVQDAEARCR